MLTLPKLRIGFRLGTTSATPTAGEATPSEAETSQVAPGAVATKPEIPPSPEPTPAPPPQPNLQESPPNAEKTFEATPSTATEPSKSLATENPKPAVPQPEPDGWHRWTARFLISEMQDLRDLAQKLEHASGFKPSDHTMLRAMLRSAKHGGDWRYHAQVLHSQDGRRK